MPRPREHNPEEIRKLTFRCFWQKGFSNTSMADLRKVTGLDPKQFLRDYGSKRGVFLQALRDFADIAASFMLGPLEHGSEGLTDIRKTLDKLVSTDGEEDRWGCLVCCTAQDSTALTDADIAQFVRDYFQRIEDAYHKALERASANNEYDSQSEFRAISRSLMATHVALLTLKRGGAEPAVLRDVANLAFASLT